MDGGNGYQWIPANGYSCGSLEGKAVLAGYEAHDRSPIYVGRTQYGGELMPCKVIPRHRVAYVSHNMQEIRVESFEMYCKSAARIEWRHSSNGTVPPGAVLAGRTSTGEPLYVGRVHHQGSLTPGKVHPSHGCCYIPFGGQEVSHKMYEVMVHVFD